MRKIAFFRRIFLRSRRFREWFTSPGLIVVNLAIFSGAFGLDTRANLAHSVFSLCVSLLIVDALGAWLVRRLAPAITAQRRLPEFVMAGEPARYRVELRTAVSGRSVRRARSGLRLAERLRQPWPSPQAMQKHRSREQLAGNLFDQRVGYPAFIDMLRRLRSLDIVPVALPRWLPGQMLTVDVPVLPTARGMAVFEEMHLLLSGPLGLIELRQRVAVPGATLPVLPRRQAVDLAPVTSHRHLQPGGASLMQRVGDAEEFRSLRDYRPGDPLRSIHWRSFARTGIPMVKEYQEEFFTRHALVLDTAASYPFAPAFETAVSLAAWLVTRPRDADSLLDLLFVGDRVHRLTAGRGLGEADAMLRLLATVAPSPPESIETLLNTVLHHATQVATVVVILLAWDDARRQAMRRLLASGAQVTILWVDDGPADSLRESAEDAAEFVGLLQRVPSTRGVVPVAA